MFIVRRKQILSKDLVVIIFNVIIVLKIYIKQTLSSIVRHITFVVVLVKRNLNTGYGMKIDHARFVEGLCMLANVRRSAFARMIVRSLGRERVLAT